MERIIIKLGTQVVIDESDGNPAFKRLQTIVSECATLAGKGSQIALVSSGAVGLGRKQLGLNRVLSLHEKQACAALGQSTLMNMYRELFTAHGYQVAQILVTASDFSDRERYLNLRNCFEECFKLGVIPIVNENDVVSTAGIIEKGNAKSFDDNDRLSSILAAKIQAQRLILLTNVDGVYSDNPAKNPNATLLRTLESEHSTINTDGVSDSGRGGMASKLNAAKIASLCGIETTISSGFISNPIEAALSKSAGTLIPPKGKLNSRNAWIGVASGYQGVIKINACTTSALKSDNKMSLLPIGVTDIIGDFEIKDIVSVQDDIGTELARGLVSMSAATLIKIKGMHSEAAKPLLAKEEKPEVIHRDNLVVLI